MPLLQAVNFEFQKSTTENRKGVTLLKATIVNQKLSSRICRIDKLTSGNLSSRPN